MTVYRTRCLSCGIEMDPSYRYQDCPACRQLQATENLHRAQQHNSGNSYGGGGYSSGGSGGYSGGGGGGGGAGDDPYDLVGWTMIIIGIFGVFWLAPPFWLIVKFFFGLVFGSGD